MTRRKRWEMQILFLFLYFIKASHSTLKITLYSSIFKVSLCLHYLHTTLCLHPRNRYHPIVQQNQSYNNASRITQSTQPHHRPETTQTADQQWSNTQSFEGNETPWARVLNVRLEVFPKGQSRPRLGDICPLICRKQAVGRHIITRHHFLVCCVGGRGYKSLLPGPSVLMIMICTDLTSLVSPTPGR